MIEEFFIVIFSYFLKLLVKFIAFIINKMVLN